MLFNVTVHLSSDFSRTSDIAHGFDPSDSFAKAAAEGVYNGTQVVFTIEDASHLHAAETVWAICNSYPDEMFCDERYADIVAIYRSEGLRSFSMGDMVVIRNLDVANDPQDGRYVAVRVGFERIDAVVPQPKPRLVAPRFTHQLDGLPAAILPDLPDDKGRVNVWMAGDTYRVSLAALNPLSF